MAAQQNFRTAFNGFNREDVVHYIEYLNAKHAAEVNQLRSELDFLNSKQVPADQEELETLKAEKEALEAQLEEATVAGTEIADQLNAAVAERDALSAQLEEARKEIAALTEKVDAARNQKVTFESRTAEELAAYRRAEHTERLARERAEQMYRQANGIIADATVKVSDAAAQIGALSDTVMAQLDGLRQTVAGSSEILKDAASAMYAVRPEAEI